MIENLDLLIWTLWHAETPDGFPEHITVAGNGPFLWPNEQMSNAILPNLRRGGDVVGYLNKELQMMDFAGLLLTTDHILVAETLRTAVNFDTLVVGRTGWSEEEVFSAIEACTGKQLKVYSEEMLVSFLLTGRDPFDEPEELLLRFAAGHPALEYIQSLSADFDWPSTYVSPSFGNGASLDLDFSKDSLPGILGYRVGKSSPLTTAERRAKLDQVMQIHSTPRLVESLGAAYMNDWGEPGTPQRLRKLADWLGAMCRLEKRRLMNGYDMRQAIADRESDLEWLKDRYYRKPFVFRWPSTYVEEL